MAMWLVRGGKYGQYEEKFFADSRIYLTWNGIENTSLENAKSFERMRELVTATYPDKSPAWVSQNAGQFWAFAVRMKEGDLVVTPRKGTAAIAIGEIRGPYRFDPSAEGLFRHSRSVTWSQLDVPRSALDQDILLSLGAYTTICEIKRNDAERRVRAKLLYGSVREAAARYIHEPAIQSLVEHEESSLDLVRIARDQIAEFIEAEYKTHDLAHLIGAILAAQGYTVHVSPEGPDKGIDILAAPGSLGFGHPRICVQVKSGSTPVDRPTLDQLLGAMSNVDADQGLLVSWGGFKRSVEREVANQFFRVRLWDSDAVVEQLLASYDKLADDIRAEIPLQRVWVLVPESIDETDTS